MATIQNLSTLLQEVIAAINSSSFLEKEDFYSSNPIIPKLNDLPESQRLEVFKAILDSVHLNVLNSQKRCWVIAHMLKFLPESQRLEIFQAILKSESFQTMNGEDRVYIYINGPFDLPEPQRLEIFQVILNSESYQTLTDGYRGDTIVTGLRALPESQRLDVFQAILKSESFQTLDDMKRSCVIVGGLNELPESQRLDVFQAILKSESFQTLNDEYRQFVMVDGLKGLPTSIQNIFLVPNTSDDQDTILLCPKGSINPEHSFVVRFNKASTQIGMIGMVFRREGWTEVKAEFVERDEGLEQTLPDQHQKMGAVFGIVAKMDDIPEETREGIQAAVKILNPDGIMPQGFKLPEIIFFNVI